MLYQVVSIVLCALLATPPMSASQNSQAEKIRSKLVEMRAGNVVEVIQTDGRWKGRLGELGVDSFSVQVAGKAGVEERSFRYGEVRNVKDLSNKGMSTGSKVVLGVLAGFGVLAVISIIVAAAQGWD